MAAKCQIQKYPYLITFFVDQIHFPYTWVHPLEQGFSIYFWKFSTENTFSFVLGNWVPSDPFLAFPILKLKFSSFPLFFLFPFLSNCNLFSFNQPIDCWQWKLGEGQKSRFIRLQSSFLINKLIASLWSWAILLSILMFATFLLNQSIDHWSLELVQGPIRRFMDMSFCY